MAHADHESFIGAVRVLATARIAEPGDKTRLDLAKMVYGIGAVSGARGVTYYSAWQNGETHDFIEVAASCEESPIQLAGTTIHELAHVLAGPGAGHSATWKKAANRLGLVNVEAAGQAYDPSHFEPALWAGIAALPSPTDGKPLFAHGGNGSGFAGFPRSRPRPCPLGIGTRGGKSRGPGSGSRLRLWICKCSPPVRVRVASDDFDARCGRCVESFVRG